MKIGIDLDDVVFEFTKEFIKFYNQKYEKNIIFEDVKTYYFEEVFNLPLIEIIHLIEELVSRGVGWDLPVCEDAKKIILNLGENHEIIFLTSRTVRKGTLESLKSHFPNLVFKLIFSSNVYGNSGGKTKEKICNDEGIRIMIEDSPEYAKNIAKKGIRVFLLDKPWNQDYEQHPNIIKINHWKEVENYIK